MHKCIIKNKNSVYIDSKAKIGENVIIYEFVVIDGASVIEDNVTIYPHSIITNSIIGKGSKIYSASIENSEIGSCCSVGVYSCIKSGVKIKNFVKVGSGAAIKNSVIDERSEVGHNAVVIGANLGKNCKLSASSVIAGSCEKSKPKIDIGNDSDIGANACIMYPCTLASSSVVEPCAKIGGENILENK